MTQHALVRSIMVDYGVKVSDLHPEVLDLQPSRLPALVTALWRMTEPVPSDGTFKGETVLSYGERPAPEDGVAGFEASPNGGGGAGVYIRSSTFKGITATGGRGSPDAARPKTAGEQARHIVCLAQHEAKHEQTRHDARVWLDAHDGGRCPCNRCVRDEAKFQAAIEKYAPKRAV